MSASHDLTPSSREYDFARLTPARLTFDNEGSRCALFFMHSRAFGFVRTVKHEFSSASGHQSFTAAARAGMIAGKN